MTLISKRQRDTTSGGWKFKLNNLAVKGLTLTTLKYLVYTMETKGHCIQFEIIINVSVCSFWFIWIRMLWVYGHYKYFNSFSAWIVFRCQNLTSSDVRLCKDGLALKGLKCVHPIQLQMNYIHQLLITANQRAVATPCFKLVDLFGAQWVKWC